MRPLRTELLALLDRLAPYLRTVRCEEQLEQLRSICTQGNSSDRQRAVYARTGHVEDVVRHNVREFEAGAPVPDALN